MNLFDPKPASAAPASLAKPAPLADRMRPADLAEFAGQEHLVAAGGPLRAALKAERVPSMIFWGPPGCGKTTLARLMARESGLDFVQFSAVTSGVKEIREVIERARQTRRHAGRGTILFVDEIHRFNKAQQDAFLPHVEDGTVVLVGATTENPSFEVNSALLSRSRVYRMERLSEEEVWAILRRALSDKERGLGGQNVDAPPRVIEAVAGLSEGDARVALNLLDLVVATTPPGPDGVRHLTEEAVRAAAQKKALLYDKSGEEHFNVVSAFIKSMRASDPQAAVYWMSRMLEAGEDPLYVARRMVRFACEDVGLADPAALRVSLAAKDAVDFIGLPEGNLALAQAAVYLATAPKSNALWVACDRAGQDLQKTQNEPVPMHLRNAVTPLMKDAGYGKGYQYAHDHPGHFAPEMTCLPEGLADRKYYEPTAQGFEKEIGRRMEEWEGKRAASPARKKTKSGDKKG
ncbi:MAG: replication-associated recombination protein A [Planctomycetes bacterium]|nr:replication-associated recombination protein A [Planctomycetota bacterium]